VASAGTILRVASTNQFSRHLEDSDTIAERTATLGGLAHHANAFCTVQQADALGDDGLPQASPSVGIRSRSKPSQQQPHAVDRASVQDPLSILGDEDQMNMPSRNTMLATIEFFTDPHGPNILRPC